MGAGVADRKSQLRPFVYTWVMRSVSALLAVVATSALALSACASTDDLTFICSNDERICKQWSEDFESDTGISARYLRLPTSEALARIDSNANAPEFDVWAGGPSETYVVAAQRGLLEPYRPTHLAEIPTQYRDLENRWFGVYASILALCSNPEVIDQLGVPAPSSWKELENPEFESWISASSPLSSGTAFTALWTQKEVFEDAAGNHLRAVYKNVDRFTQSGTAPAQVVASGEAAVAISFAPYCDLQTKSGRDLVVLYPRDGTFYEVGSAALLKNSAHPNAAQKFLDWLTSARGQESYSRTGIQQMPITRQLPGNLEDFLYRTQLRVIDTDSKRAAQERVEWINWFVTNVGLR